MGSRVTSNYDEVDAAIRGVAASWDLRAPGLNRSLGDDALDLIAEMIQVRTVIGQQRPDGKPLARLKIRTLLRKRKLGYPETISVETGAMMDFSELQGERQITRRIAVVTYGTNEETRLKAEWFTEGRPHYQKARPFFEIDGQIEAAIDKLFEDVLEKNIKSLGG